MNIKLQINEHEFVNITKSNNYGFNLEHIYPTVNPKTKQPSVGSKVYFYADLHQVADKLIWLGLEGDTLGEVLCSVVCLSERLAGALEQNLEKL